MLLPLAFLIVLIQTPVWLLMMIAPQQPLTDRLTRSYLIFIPIIVMYILFLIAMIIEIFSLNNTFSIAIRNIPTVPSDNLQPVLNAIQRGFDVPSALLSALLATTVLDLAAGILASNEMERLGTPVRTQRAMLAAMFLLGPVGMLVFAIWHLRNQRPTATQPPVGSGGSTPPSTPSISSATSIGSANTGEVNVAPGS
ncbi:MAG: DUF4281 domain-containing protein [Armatimonadetes bacterium]|nr:DUF4281 domain-containing protein [Anaerolineae bacterium]